MRSDDSHLELIDRYLNGFASESECTKLEELLTADPQLRADYLAYTRLDAALPSAVHAAGESDLMSFEKTGQAKRQIPVFSLLTWVSAVAIALLAVALVAKRLATPNASNVAVIETLTDVRWTSESAATRPGDGIRAGQRLELGSGVLVIRFSSGALLELIGPAIIETRSENSSFLTMGEARVVADTPESKGFTLATPTSDFVDIGTSFIAQVSPDGLSRLDVTDGEVDVVLKGTAPRRFRSGESVYVEPGNQKIITRIESGDGSSEFIFPTIPAPSSADYADESNGYATIQVANGELSAGKSGLPSVLIDGKGQYRQDAPRQSAFFKTGTHGSFLIDLGQPIAISSINTYSWHQHKSIEEHRERARQSFTLYGYPGEKMPALSGERGKAGWTRIARINSDQFFQVNDRLDRPAQQACSISAAEGEVGPYRYLLWDVKSGSFYGEIDIFGQP